MASVFVPALGLGQVAGQFRDEFLQVGPGAEVPPDAGDHGDPSVGVVAKGGPRMCQIPEMLHVERIARLGTVDRDRDDVRVQRVVNAQSKITASDLPNLGLRHPWLSDLVTHMLSNTEKMGIPSP